MKTLFVDLDGTLLNVFDRLYIAYGNACPIEGLSMTKKEFIKQKREKNPLPVMSHYFDLLEKMIMLENDTLYPDAVKFLKTAKEKGIRIILITLRNNRDNLLNQLKELKIKDLFDEIICVHCTAKVKRYLAKAEAIKSFKGQKAIIGDTETDILAGKTAKAKTIAITRGMRSKEFLEKYKPDFFVDNLKSVEFDKIF